MTIFNRLQRQTVKDQFRKFLRMFCFGSNLYAEPTPDPGHFLRETHTGVRVFKGRRGPWGAVTGGGFGVGEWGGNPSREME